MYHMILDPIAALPPGGVARFGELRLLLKWLYEESKKKETLWNQNPKTFFFFFSSCVCVCEKKKKKNLKIFSSLFFFF